MNLRKIIRAGFVAMMALLPTLALPAFDPVHEDIDIFMVNPSVTSSRPNVLIVLDNTANWNQAFTNEKSALVQVLNGLTSQFNVGLGMYVETGSPNDNVDGGYIRFAVRQMQGDAKTTLSTMVNNLDQSGDKGNNNTIGLAMSEAYKYFLGGTSYSSYGKVKADYAGNTLNPANTLGENALPASPNSSSLFASPVSDNCQKNFIIYIGNGKFNENTSALSTAQSRLQTAMGTAPQTIALSPSGQQGNWADEWAQFMAKTGFLKTIKGAQKRIFVNTYAVAIDPAQQNLWGSGSSYATNDSLRLMKSMSEDNGNGKYFEVSSGSGGSEIADALTQIFNEIQSVNSVFASTTLPVSVNVRGTNLNQVYIGMFRPHAKKAPRWMGNLKLYKLAADANRNLFLVDAQNVRAEDPATGFVAAARRSFWTHDSSFWNFRTDAENGVGGASDSPDGNIVEKGAVGQYLRETYATSQAARNLFTCTVGTSPAICSACSIGGSGTGQTCTGGSALSVTPFATSNDGITPANLGLGTKDVTSLSAKVTKTVTSLTDRRSATLTNSAGATVSVTLSNGAVTGSVGSLSTASTRSLTRLTARTGGTITSITDATTGSGTTKTNTFTVTTSEAHYLTAGSSVTISGNTATGGSDINNTYTIATVPSTTTFTFVGAIGNLKFGSDGTATGVATSTTAYATLSSHGFSNGAQVTIANASPTAFNGTYGITVVDTNTFKYTIASAQGVATTLGTATANTTTATATTSAAHGMVAGNSLTISGADAGYNGTFTVLASPAPTANTFSYTVASALAPNTASGVTYYKVGSGSTAVTATSVGAHGLSDGVYNISGPNSCFTNGGSINITTTGSTTFTYTTAGVCASSPGTGYQVSGTALIATVTATLPNHNFSTQCAGGNVTVYGTDVNHAGTWGPITVVDGNTFTYSTGVAKPFPSGVFTVACAASPRAFAQTTAHGFSNGNVLTVGGVDTSGGNAGNSVYNTTAAISFIDADNFSYPLTAGPAGPATTTGTITASMNTTTATAYVANHGFSNGSSITIAGASPSAFNGTFAIAVTGTNTFTYALGAAQGDASGTIVASAASGTNSERDLLINWVRGQDNVEDENLNSSTTDCRASVHGDVLHSRPAVLNYNRFGGDNDVYIFYGSNDGVFRSVKGGMGTDAGDTSNLSPGQEAWGFVPEESFTFLKRLRNNTPVIGSAFKRPYFMDGPIAVYSLDANSDGKFKSADNDLVYLYIGARRGGRYLYSIDASNPLQPSYRWRVNSTITGFGELGYTWSQPVVVNQINGYTNPVLVMGGGYDPAVEDIENCTIQSATSTAVQYFSGPIKYTQSGCVADDGSTNGVAIASTSTPNATVSRSMGRAIYVIDAITGAKIWSAGRTGSGADLEVAGMDYAIASDPLVVRNLSGGLPNRAYFADTGGNVWRLDFGDTDRANWTVTKLASLSNLGSASNRRKFLYPPDVVKMAGYDAVLIGSGDREHPFDMTVTNRFYMLKDFGDDTGPLTGTTGASGANPTLTEAVLFNATSVSQTTASASASAADKEAAVTAAEPGLAAAQGWYVTFSAGEKDVGGAVALNGVVFFNTNVSPMSPAVTSGETCESNLGIANKYKVDITNASTTKTSHNGGGYLPTPTHVVVTVPITYTDAATGQQVTKNETIEGVISGTDVSQPAGVTLGTRSRKFWYKEID